MWEQIPLMQVSPMHLMTHTAPRENIYFCDCICVNPAASAMQPGSF